MTIDKNTLDKAKKWAGEILDRARPHQYADTAIAAAEVIRDLPETIVDGEHIRTLVELFSAEGNQFRMAEVVDHLQALLPAPKPRTLADMTPTERVACQWMQARDHRGKLCVIERVNSTARLLYEDGSSGEAQLYKVTPLPDLPRMAWPDEHYPENVGEEVPLEPTDEQDFADMAHAVDLAPQPGEAWLIEDDERGQFVGLNREDSMWLIFDGKCAENIYDPVVLRRLVPERTPRELTTVEDYANAKLNTVVSRGEDYTVVEKVGRDHWNSTNGTPSTDDDLAGIPRAVLWEPEA